MIPVIEPHVEIASSLRSPRRDCFVAPLLAMTAFSSVIASKAKQSRRFGSGIKSQVHTTRVEA